jgi:hypothetical protein
MSWMCDPVLKAKSVTSTVVLRLEATWAMIPFTTDLLKKKILKVAELSLMRQTDEDIQLP